MYVYRGLLAPSQHQHLITGLNLLRLLVQNRIAEFHTELELIPQQVTASLTMTMHIPLSQPFVIGEVTVQ